MRVEKIKGRGGREGGYKSKEKMDVFQILLFKLI